MSRKFSRLLFVASLVAGAGVAPMLDASAQDTRNILVKDNKFGISGSFDAFKSDLVRWTVENGEHTVTPEDPAKWDDNTGSATLKAGDTFEFLFTRAGEYEYYCEIHGREAMSGVINVTDPSAPPPPPPPPPSSSTTTTTRPPTTTTTRPPVVTTAPPATSAGGKTSTPAAPAPTTTTTEKPKDSKAGKDRTPKAEETTTTTAPPPPIDLPNEAIVPSLPGFGSGGTTTQDGVEVPGDAPEGDAVALLRSGKGGSGNAKKLLIVSGLGLGVLGLGTAGYKYANRSSRYFPA